MPFGRVFLSYARRDGNEFAKRLAADLRARGQWYIWVDQQDIRAGRSWDTEIEQAIRASDVLAAVLTPQSVVEFSVCRDEVACAFEAGKDLITLRIVDDPGLKPALLLRRREWIDFTKSYDDGLQALVLYLGGNESRVQRPVLEIVEEVRPLDFSPEIARRAMGFVGREWLMKDVDLWLDRSPKQGLAIIGPPGSGKSSIAAWLANSREDVVAAYFCSNANTHSMSAWYFVSTLVGMLHEGLDGFRAAVDMRYPHLRHDRAADAFRELIVETTVRMAPPRQPQLIIVDALDESVIVRGGRTIGESIVDVLAEQIRDLPRWLRFVTTSQPLPDVMRKLGDFEVLSLDKRAAQNLLDARQYLKQRLKEIPSGELLEDRLATVADGNFLILKHTLDALTERSLAPHELDRFAPGLTTAFALSFQRRFPIEEYQSHLVPLLNVLVVARAPVSAQLLTAASGLSETSLYAGLRSLTPYLRVDRSAEGMTYTLFHSYLRLWLTDPTMAGDYYISPPAGHLALANAGWAEFLNGACKMSSYARNHLPSHLLESERWEELLKLVQCEDLGMLSNWIDRDEGDVGLDCLSGIVCHLEKDRSRFGTEVGLSTQIARIHIRRGAYEEAEQRLSQVLRRTSWRRGRRARVVALHEWGSLHLYRSQYLQAANCYRRALWLCRIGVPQYHDEAAANLVGLAVVEQENFRFKKAERYAEHGIRSAKAGHDAAHLVAAFRVQALARRGLAKYEEAEAALRMAMALTAIHNVTAETPRLLLTRGWIEYDRDTLASRTLENSAATFRRGLDESVRLANRYCIMEAKLSLAWCALAEGEADGGEDWLEQLSVLLPLGRHLGLWAGHAVGRAAALHVRLRLSEAREAYEHAISVCGENQSITWGVRARVGLGATLWHEGRKEEALDIWRQGLTIASAAAVSLEHVATRAIARCRENASRGPR